jgi:hypothetical protein
MKVIPERETLWAWLSKSVAVLGKVFEMPLNEKNYVAGSAKPKPAAAKDKHDLLIADDSTHSEEGLVPGLELIDDASLN